MSSAEVASKDASSIESPPSSAVFGLVLLIVGAIGFSPWLIAKYARETPRPSRKSMIIQERFRNWQSANLSRGGASLSSAAERALQLEHERHFYEAIEQYSVLINGHRNLGLNYLRRGICYFYLNRFDLAIADLNNSIAHTPDDADAYTYRAAAYHRLGQEDKAAADMIQARRFTR